MREHPMCPSCKAPLRTFRTRLVCDACEGMLAPLDDLATAIEDITGVSPSFDYEDAAPGKRACPACLEVMDTLKLLVHLDGELVSPKPTLDRCMTHGLWFDTDELAVVFEKARAAHPGGSGAHVRKPGSGGGGGSWSGDQKGPFWWGGGHGNY
jgi:hypothetical protein